MSELRLNILNGNWTVIAPERGNKPKPPADCSAVDIRTLPVHDESCPFCPGNEEQFPIEILGQAPSSGAWQARLIENKYKIFDDHADCPIAPEPFDRHGVHFSYKGCGNHYLVLEHPEHNRVMGKMEPEEITAVFQLYRTAVQRLSANPNNQISVIFKNQGRSAGGSQPHAHSQLVGSRVVPAWIRFAMNEQQRYFDQQGECALCAMLRFEEEAGLRVLAATKHVVLLSPYAAAAPYEVWVVPRNHHACFSELEDGEIAALAEGVGQVLRRYVDQLGNPDFNYFFHSAPQPLAAVPYLHFFVRIVPRLLTHGGFEIGTGMTVNPMAPEAVKGVLFPDAGCWSCD